MYKMIGNSWCQAVLDMLDWGIGIHFMFWHLKDWKFELQIGPVQLCIYQCELPTPIV
jgi:hypothetical protein